MSESQITRIIAVVAAGQIDWYIRSAATALLAYEYMVAFDREVDLFWKRKLTMATVLFIANRYVPLAATIMNLPYSVTIQSCGPVSYTLNVVRIAQYLPWAVFSAARVFVLSSRTWFIALGVFLLSMSPVIIDCVTLAYLNVISNGIECGAVIKLSISSQHRLAILSRTCLIAADIVVLAITWNATFKMSRESRAVGQRASLSAIMFRDGVIYFLILLVTNILHLSFTLPSIATPVASNPASSIVVLSEPFTAILMSRFLMDLQEANNSMVHADSLSSVRSLDFNRFIGSLGSSLPAPGQASDAVNNQSADIGLSNHSPEDHGAEDRLDLGGENTSTTAHT